MAKLLTTEEAADTLRVSTRTIYSWLKEGKLSGQRVGRKWLIEEDELRALLTRPQAPVQEA